MGRFFLVLIILLALGFTFPQSREVILDVSEPAREVMINPFRKWVTNQELRQIVTDLERWEDTRGSIPMRPEEFDRWLNDRYRQESSRMDSWGTRYGLQVLGDQIIVISAGPDGEFGTEDDLTQEGLRARARR
jgi:hypothetical protein